MNPDKDEIEIPEAVPEEFSPRQTGAMLGPGARFGLAILVGLLVIGGAFVIRGNRVADPASSIRANAELDATPGGAVQSDSPRYQELLELSNDEAAERAELEGRSFIPTPESVPEPVEEESEPATIELPEPAPVFAPSPLPQPELRVHEDSPPDIPYRDEILEQMSAIAPGSGRPALAIQETGRSEYDAREKAAAPSAANSVQHGEAGDRTIFPAGEIVHAVTLLSASSDLDGAPILAELTEGDRKGARLIGSFRAAPESDGLVVEFDSMTLPDGRTLNITAFAVDVATAETVVASGVERRFLRRYVPVLASSFVSAFADTLAAPGRTLATLGGETIAIEPSGDRDRALYAGLGAAAEAVGGDLAAAAPEGPRIVLRAGWPIAVMFAESAIAEVRSRNPAAGHPEHARSGRGQ